jgi:hypothetical protein
MSYEKAMKHRRNIRKCKKQSNMYFGFDCSEPISAERQLIKDKIMNSKNIIAQFYSWRHLNPQDREICIDEISVLRNLRKQSQKIKKNA